MMLKRAFDFAESDFLLNQQGRLSKETLNCLPSINEFTNSAFFYHNARFD